MTPEQRLRYIEQEERKRCGRPPLRDDEPSPIERLCVLLVDTGVEFVIIGGQAEVLMGSYRNTEDIDVCHQLTPANQNRLLGVLQTLEVWNQPPPGEPDFTGKLGPDLLASMVQGRGLNIIINNDIWVDFHGNLPIVGAYERVVQHAETVQLAGRSILIQGLDDHIRCLVQLAEPMRLDSLDQLEAIRAARRET